ncbi:MAG: hypothetical protein KJ771_08975, partial [Nanoarchaeota archaeon]|nr:hypothetical protein [Nanoarchaeota archaeon]
YMTMFHTNMDKKKYYIIYYGKMSPNRNFSELTKIFKDYGNDYHPNIDKIIKKYEDIANEKMLPFDWWTGPAGSTAVPSNCEAIQGGISFRCTSEKMDITGAFNREEVIALYDSNKVGFRAADPCIVSTSYWKFKDMLSRGENDDKDVDGVPDSFEVLPEDTAESTEEAAEPSEEITPPSDISEPSAPLPASTPQDVFKGPVGFDEGGACNLISTASVNPASFLIVAALLALVRRRKK